MIWPRRGSICASSMPIKKIKTKSRYQLLNVNCILLWLIISPKRIPIPNAKKAFAIFFKALKKRLNEILPCTLCRSISLYVIKQIPNAKIEVVKAIKSAGGRIVVGLSIWLSACVNSKATLTNNTYEKYGRILKMRLFKFLESLGAIK